MNNLLRLMNIRNYTVLNVKEEALLVVVHSLLSDYIDALDKGIDKPLLEERNEENEIYIKKVCLEIIEYLENEKMIIPAKTMDAILEISIKENKFIDKALLLEPIAFFYDVVTKTYLSNTNMLITNENGKQYWIPELLAFSLILDFKDKGYNFTKFEFIKNFDFTKTMQIYYDISNKMDKLKGDSIIKKRENNPIRAIQDISLIIINKLVSTKYIDKSKSSKKTRKGKNGRRKK